MAANPDYLAAQNQAAKIIPTVKLLINGEFVESRSTQWRDIVNPATQEVLARVPFTTADEMEAAIAHAARKAWAGSRRRPVRGRPRGPSPRRAP